MALVRSTRDRRTLIAGGLLLLLPLPASAQRPTATIVGIVKDSTGGVIHGATVTATDEARGFTRSIVTNAAGSYSLPALDAGRYQLRVAYPRFRTKVITAITLNVADARVIDVVLEPGEVFEETTVEAAELDVQTTGGELSGLVTGEQIRDLPLNGRNLMQLTLLQPGVIPADFFNAKDKGLLGLSGVAASGGHAAANMWTVDGVNNNEGGGVALLVFPSIDTVEEFRIHRNSYGAEFGQASGAQINIVTRGGANAFHGGVFYSMRDDALSATNYFLRRAGQEKEKLSRHDFGWNLAGPIIKDKLHFFALQEWNREARGDVRRALVPTAAERVGDFSEPGIPGCSGPDPIDPLTGQAFPGSRIPAERLSPAGLLLLQLYSLPNTNPVDGSCANWVASVDTPINWREDSVRLDYAINDSVRLMARYIQDSWVNGAPNLQSRLWGDDPFPIVDSRWSNPGRSLLLQLNHSVGSAGTNSLRFSYAGNEISVTRGGTAAQLNDAINAAIPPLSGVDTKLYGAERAHASADSGVYGMLINAAPFYNLYESIAFRDDYSAAFGRHFVKAGVLASWNRKEEDTGGFGGSESPFIFDSPAGTGNVLADRLLRDVAFSFYERSAQQLIPLRWRDFEIYLADTWRPSSRVTLDLGLRYSRFLNPYAVNDRILNFQPDSFDPALGADPCNGLMQPPQAHWCEEAGFSGGELATNRSLSDQEYDLIAPRTGAAWDVFGDGRTAIRAGVGLFFEHDSLRSPLHLATNPPFTNAVFGLRTLDSAEEPCAGCFSADGGVPLGGRERKALTPNTWQWNLTFEQALLRNATLMLSYVGSRGTHLLRLLDINQVRRGDRNANGVSDRLEYAQAFVLPEVRPYGVFGDTRIDFFDHGGGSIYHALETQLRARWGRGGHFQASYTWSRTLSDVPEYVVDVDRPDLDRGLALAHRAHVFSTSLVLPLPTLQARRGLVRHLFGNWEIGALAVAASGTPLAVVTGSVPGFNGGPSGTGDGFNQPPDRVPGQPCRARYGLEEQWLNPEAFTLAGFELGTIGDGGRGTCVGPGLFQVDLALYKDIPLGNRVTLQLRFEAFNVFNRTQFTGVDVSMDPTAVTLDAPIERASRITSFELPSSFGQATAARDPRQLQLGINLRF